VKVVHNVRVPRAEQRVVNEQLFTLWINHFIWKSSLKMLIFAPEHRAVDLFPPLDFFPTALFCSKRSSTARSPLCPRRFLPSGKVCVQRSALRLLIPRNVSMISAACHWSGAAGSARLLIGADSVWLCAESDYAAIVCVYFRQFVQVCADECVRTERLPRASVSLFDL